VKCFQLIVIPAILITLLWTSIDACTGIKLKNEDDSIVHGRTLEFGVFVETSVAIVPRGYKFVGTTPQGPGLVYKSKYAVVGAMAYGIPSIMDGINEKGLSIGIFYFPGFAGYSTITEQNQRRALSPVEFSNWIITQFATVDEVKSSLSSVVIAPTINKEWGPNPPPFHYIVYDKSGQCLVIEPIEGKLISYDNPLGVFTNSPTFDWHMMNLRNFINLTPLNVKPINLAGVQLAPFGQGSGMVGLPGDFTPPSRFVRAAIFSTMAPPSKDANKGIFQAFHILNQFDIPVGVVREKDQGVLYNDSTLLTAVRDPQNLKYYFKTYEDPSIRFVDLTKFDYDAASIKQTKMLSQEKAIDISNLLSDTLK
jgi:choloylglycine hydrolase